MPNSRLESYPINDYKAIPFGATHTYIANNEARHKLGLFQIQEKFE